MDLYLQKYKICTSIISSSMHIANIVSSILAVRLYEEGDWLYVGVGLAGFSCLPLFLLPTFNCVQKPTDQMEKDSTFYLSSNGNVESCDLRSRDTGLSDVESPEVEAQNVESCKVKTKKSRDDQPLGQMSSLNLLQKIIFYIPDAALFLNNILFNVLIFNLTDRMVTFSGKKMDTAILFVNLLNVFSFLGAIGLGFIADKKLNIFEVMIFGNVAFHAGYILTFGSTTTFINFPFEFEIGSVLIGLGDAAIVNLSIMSKFVLFERWSLSPQGLGALSAETHNLVLNLSVAFGIFLSGFTLSEESEIPVLCSGAAIFLLVSIGLILCKVNPVKTSNQLQIVKSL